jgi:S1-C subfamily serine protease
MAAILPKDKILTIDGSKVKNFSDIEQFTAFGNTKDKNDKPSSVIEIERNGEKLKLTVKPVVISNSNLSSYTLRVIAVSPKQTLIINKINSFDSLKNSNLEKGDRIISVNGIPMLHVLTLQKTVTSLR